MSRIQQAPPVGLAEGLDDAMQLMAAVNMHLHRLSRRLHDDGEQEVARQMQDAVAKSIRCLRGLLSGLLAGGP